MTMKTDAQAAPHPENGPKPPLSARLWTWMQGLDAPAPLPLASQGLTTTPLVPATMATEAVPDAYGDFQRAEIAQTRYLMDRICAINNANVVDQVGPRRTVDRSRPVQDLTADEWGQAARLAGVVVVDPPASP